MKFHCTSHILDGVKIGAGSWHLPPINIFVFVKSLGIAAGVFGIVVLLKMVAIRINFVEKRYQAGLEYIGVPSSIHYTWKKNNSSSSSCRYFGPNINFGRVFRLHF